MNKILILGASGFIGNTLYKELLPYYDVYGTYASQQGTFKENQVFFEYRVEEGGLDTILNTVQPNIIISSLRGDYSAQYKAHELLVEYCHATQSRLLLLSSVNVFDGVGTFPAYEDSPTDSLSDYGRSKMDLEKLVSQLPKQQYSILRIPMVLGVTAPRICKLRLAIKHDVHFEVYPNLIISITTANKLAQQVHYIINQEVYGILHLASKDVIHHRDLFKEISEKISDKKPIFKNVYESNEDRYLAILPKKYKLPKPYRITVAQVIEDSTLKEEINTLKTNL
ncbi:MAG: sugar nucleotide-binding protein [Bacteroidetes bacterium]|nr:sugar nucleotide-binding protein [Bacteroidota bacterium]